MSDRDDDNDHVDDEIPVQARDDGEDDLDETQPHDDGDNAAGTDGDTPAVADTPAPVEEEEEDDEPLPPEKAWTGAFDMHLPGCAGLQSIKAAVADSATLPAWLTYVLADDVFYFRRALFPDEQGKKKKTGGLQEDSQPDGDGDEGDAPAPPPVEENAEEEDGDDGAGASGAQGCVPNRCLYIHQARDGTFHLVTELEDQESRPTTTTPAAGGTRSGAAAATDTAQPEAGDEEDEALGGDASGTAEPAAAEDDPSNAEGEATEGKKTPRTRRPTSATKAASENTAEATTAVQQLLNFKIDILTLAALKSPSIFAIMLPMPNTTLDGLVEWAMRESSSTEHLLSCAAQVKAEANERAQLSNKAAQKSSKPLPQARVVIQQTKMSFDPFFVAINDDPRKNKVLLQAACALAKSGCVPRGPIDTEALLTSADSVWLYIELLRSWPRSLVTGWTLPLPADGDDPLDDETRKTKPLSYILGSIILDGRRRATRSLVGKSALRTSALRSLRGIMPKLFAAEQGDDSTICRAYAPKADGTLPVSLHLFQSDLILLCIGSFGEASVAELFADVLRLRVEHPNRSSIHDDRAGFWHVLFHNLHRLQPWAAQELFNAAPFQRLFVRGGLARVDDFSARYLFEYDGRFAQAPGACDEAVERNQFFLSSSSLAKTFTAKFWSEFTECEPVMISLERQASSYLPTLMEAQRAYRDVLDVTLSHRSKSLTEEHVLRVLEQAWEGAVGPQPVALNPTIFHTTLMGLAMDAQNYFVVKFLAQRAKIVSVRTHGGHSGDVGLLDEALRRGDKQLLRVLIDLGLELSQTLRGGLFSGVAALQAPDDATLPTEDAIAAAEAEATALIEHWMIVSKDRIADPERRNGLLLSLPVPPQLASVCV